MIKNFPQRMRRLSTQLAQQRLDMHLDEQGRTPAQVIRERRLRLRGEEGGQQMPTRGQDPVASSGRPQTLSEVIRSARLKKRLEGLGQESGYNE